MCIHFWGIHCIFLLLNSSQFRACGDHAIPSVQSLWWRNQVSKRWKDMSRITRLITNMDKTNTLVFYSLPRVHLCLMGNSKRNPNFLKEWKQHHIFCWGSCYRTILKPLTNPYKIILFSQPQAMLLLPCDSPLVYTVFDYTYSILFEKSDNSIWTWLSGKKLWQKIPVLHWHMKLCPSLLSETYSSDL